MLLFEIEDTLIYLKLHQHKLPLFWNFILSTNIWNYICLVRQMLYLETWRDFLGLSNTRQVIDTDMQNRQPLPYS